MRKLPLLFIFCSILSNGCVMKEEADLIVKNGKIYTVDPESRITDAFAVRDGKFIYTGTDEDVLAHYTSANILDAGGKSIYPGFIDAHCHFYGYGTSLQTVDLTGTKSFTELVERLRNSDKAGNTWITGRGWDQNDWEKKEFPDRELLDKYFPDTPVLLTRIDGHAAIVNNKAIEISGITLSTIVKGGEFITKNGRLTGVLIDGAIGHVSRHIPVSGKDQIESALLNAQEKCFEVGLTSVHDAGLGSNVIDIIRGLEASGRLKMNIYAMLSAERKTLEKYMYSGIHKSKHLHIRSLKLFADGALGSRGARMIEPYSDDKDNRGLWTSTSEELAEFCRLADSCGFQVNTHCIGDAATREVLAIYSRFLEKGNDKRWRIEHAQVVDGDDFIKFREYSVIPSVQATHATSDMYWAEERLGRERVKNAYAFKLLLEQNGWIPNGSDFPVESINPLFGFYAAVSRKDRDSYPDGGYQYENALTREEALKAMTIWAAKASFEEDERGSIEPGKSADFVICDMDIMNVEEKMIFTTRVENTFVSGEEVFRRK